MELYTEIPNFLINSRQARALLEIFNEDEDEGYLIPSEFYLEDDKVKKNKRF